MAAKEAAQDVFCRGKNQSFSLSRPLPRLFTSHRIKCQCITYCTGFLKEAPLEGCTLNSQFLRIRRYVYAVGKRMVSLGRASANF